MSKIEDCRNCGDRLKPGKTHQSGNGRWTCHKKGRDRDGGRSDQKGPREDVHMGANLPAEAKRRFAAYFASDEGKFGSMGNKKKAKKPPYCGYPY